MKAIVVVFFAVLAVALGNTVLIKGLEVDNGVLFHKQIKDEIVKKLQTVFSLGDDEDEVGSITAVVNEYADILFKYIESFAAIQNLDPAELENVTQESDLSSLTLWDGKLYGISTIDRNDDVVLTYVHSDKMLYVEIPVIFSKLKFTYDYHVRVLNLGPDGGMTGAIANFKADVKFRFDFNEFHAYIDEINTDGMGHIDLTFQGNGIADAVVNLLSEFTTTILHPIIEALIKGIINDVAQLIVSFVNDGLDNILRPNTTTNSTDSEEFLMAARAWKQIIIMNN